MRRGLEFLVLVTLLCGCSRAFYRRSADRETYAAIEERVCDPRWPVANIGLDRPQQSRLYDPYSPDRPPMPPDDPAAHQYMVCADGHRGSPRWNRDGFASSVEDPHWRDYLDLDKDGKLVLTPDKAVELGLQDSRAYQTALETLYQTALQLTLDRWEFALHWFLTNNTVWDHFGSSATEVNTLTTTTSGGFTRTFTAGGQLMVDLTNAFVFQFSGVNHTTTASNLAINFVQPLLRGGGRQVNLEPLTQSERNVLYAVRTFARFRKQFAVGLTTASQTGFSSLLLQVQNIRNLEANLKSQEQNFRLHEALYDLGVVSTVQVDQAFQSYQQGKLSLLQAQTSLENALDSYKQSIGLPPTLPVSLDDSVLGPFQLTAPELTQLQEDLETFFKEFRELDRPPELPKLRDGFLRLKQYHERTLKLVEQVHDELQRWEKTLGKGNKDEAQKERERGSFKKLTEQLDELGTELTGLSRDIERGGASLTEGGRKEGWELLQRRIRQEIADAGQLFVIQTQIRVYLIELKPGEYDTQQSIDFALANRLDLMNERGRVVDAWRQITVTANALRGVLNLTANANIATPLGGNNPVGFRASASDYNVGFQFEGPLNRQLERNVYRNSLINYQQLRRQFMALEDSITASIRSDIRQLETERISFEIARQALVSAARQVEGAQDRLLVSTNAADTTVTQDILNALNALLQAKSTLIASYINYETFRVQLLLDEEALQLDERGLPRDERDTSRQSAADAASHCDPFVGPPAP
jgi:outer membrane protein TolC